MDGMAVPLKWILGMVVGAMWAIANMVFTVKILKISVLKKSPAKLPIILMLKFPVLYLTGFFILKSGIFPVQSLLIGLVVTVVTMSAYKLWPKQA